MIKILGNDMHVRCKQILKKTMGLLICFCAIYIFLSCNEDKESGGFEKMIDLKLIEIGRSICATSDGGFVVCGTTNSVFQNNFDLLFVKIDRYGEVMWMKTIGGNSITETDIAYSIVETSDRNYVATGTMYINGKGLDVFAVKLDSKGQMIWLRHFGKQGIDIGYKAIAIENGESIIAGIAEVGVAGSVNDIFMARLGAGGDSVWTKYFGKYQYTDNCFSVIPVSSGGFMLTGYTNSFSGGIFSPFIIHTDATGNELFTKIIDQPDHCYIYDITETKDHHLILAGQVRVSVQFGTFAPILIKTDLDGNVIWSRHYGLMSTIASLNDVVGLSDGSIVGVGTIYVDEKNSQVYMVKTTADGQIEWEKNYGGTDDELGYSVQQAQDGGFYVIGISKPIGKTLSDIYLVKTDDNGNIK